MPHRIHSAGDVLAMIMTTLLAAGETLTEQVKATGILDNRVLIYACLIGGCLGSLCNTVLFPSRDTKRGWVVAKFVANWAAAVVFAPAFIRISGMTMHPETVLAVSAAFAIGAVSIVRYARNVVENRTGGDDRK